MERRKKADCVSGQKRRVRTWTDSSEIEREDGTAAASPSRAIALYRASSAISDHNNLVVAAELRHKARRQISDRRSHVTGHRLTTATSRLRAEVQRLVLRGERVMDASETSSDVVPRRACAAGPNDVASSLSPYVCSEVTRDDSMKDKRHWARSCGRGVSGSRSPSTRPDLAVKWGLVMGCEGRVGQAETAYAMSPLEVATLILSG